MAIALEWSLAAAPVPLDRGTGNLVYQDELPLTDVQVAPSGEICCLRRRPQEAEILVWAQKDQGPKTWLSGRSLPLLQLFGFDGRKLFGVTRDAILSITANETRVLYRSAGRIVRPSASPDGLSVLLTEERGSAGTYAAVVVGESGNQWAIVGDGEEYSEAAWLSDEEILTVVLRRHSGAGVPRHDAGDPFDSALRRCKVRGDRADTIVRTRKNLLFLAAQPGKQLAAVATAGSADGEEEYPSSCIWFIELGGEESARCVWNGLPTHRIVFSGERAVWIASNPSKENASLLVNASKGELRAVILPNRPRHFAVHPHEAKAYLCLPSKGGASELRMMDL